METNYDAIERANSAVARERVMTDLQTLTRDTQDLLHATAGDVSARAKEARARVSETLERAKTTYARVQEQSVAAAKAAAKKADIAIRERPYESIGIAFGIGLLLGVVVMRK